MADLAEGADARDGFAFIYLRRGFRASDDGTESIPSGHFKVGATCHADVGKRKTDGSLPTTSQPTAKWRVPASERYELEKKVHAALAELNIKLDSGREWFTWRKVLKEDGAAWDDLRAHERWLLAIIDGCLLVRHEPVEAPRASAPRTRTAPRTSAPRTRAAPRTRTAPRTSAPRTRAAPRASTPRKRSAAHSELAVQMLAHWRAPANHPPDAMVRALADAVRACERVPRGMRGRASEKTARSSRIALYIAAAFKRYTSWNGSDVCEIRTTPALKRYLDAAKTHECSLFSGGSDCGAGSGMQALGWVGALTNVLKLDATTEGDHVFVRVRTEGAQYAWRVEW
jgi:hypothetical protein